MTGEVVTGRESVNTSAVENLIKEPHRRRLAWAGCGDTARKLTQDAL